MHTTNLPDPERQVTIPMTANNVAHVAFPSPRHLHNEILPRPFDCNRNAILSFSCLGTRLSNSLYVVITASKAEFRPRTQHRVAANAMRNTKPIQMVAHIVTLAVDGCPALLKGRTNAEC
ncbi:unnamed protein product [Hydatigera taeniaeformis]|uniref:Uncharacterized protein n=1 Tax=Hydatigena taeniaeformis TaxID=6205 RepID=A0A0R3X884_HYDTA|nr:unnamed protein product [Hydatigera taeniaeformis]